jgi:putative aminopeptidase FrvX
MSAKLLERLRRLTGIWGPSGREEKVAGTLEEMIAPFVDQMRRDRYGNLLAVKRGGPGGRRIMLTAHMDTAGAVALNVSDRGLVYLSPVGGLQAHNAIGQRVVWGSGAVGILQCEHAEDAKEIDFKKLFCDIGAASRQEVLEQISLGDICTFSADALVLDDLVVAPGLDNRAGCAVLVEVAEHLDQTPHEVIFAFTAQGESTPRGAGVAAFSTEPDLALVVDAALAGDIPRVPRAAPRLGGGPALKLKDGGYVAHQALADFVQAVAEEQAIPLQIEISAGTSEAQVVTLSGQGVPTAVIDIPIRYHGTAAEMVNLRDLHGAADLLLKLLETPLTLM